MRKLFSILMIVCLLCGMTACSGDKEEEVTEEENQVITISVAVPGSADDNLYKLLETFKSEVETNTDNALSVILTLESELGIDGEEYESVLDPEAAVDVVFLSREKMQEKSIWLAMFDAWFMLLNYEHYRTTFDDKVGDIMFENIRADQGLQVLGTLYQDMKVFNVRNNASLYTIDDFNCLDLGVSPRESSVLEGRTLGTNPIVIVEDSINRYLADHTINAYDAFFKEIREKHFYEFTNSMVLSEHQVDFDFIAMNLDKWGLLSSDQKDVVNEAIVNLENAYDAMILAEIDEYKTFYLGYGLNLQKLNKVEFHEAFSDLYRGNVELTNTWNIEYYERILKIARKMITDNDGIIE